MKIILDSSEIEKLMHQGFLGALEILDEPSFQSLQAKNHSNGFDKEQILLFNKGTKQYFSSEVFSKSTEDLKLEYLQSELVEVVPVEWAGEYIAWVRKV